MRMGVPTRGASDVPCENASINAAVNRAAADGPTAVGLRQGWAVLGDSNAGSAMKSPSAGVWSFG
jgi:hypothetical protein